jgi:cellulose synthase/poly-beta-1,6-N-acetylglucosamine synthase-like glycosyltransferase
MSRNLQITVVIPVFEQPKHLEKMLSRLLSDAYPHKQIVVAVDGPRTPEITAALEPFRGRVKVDGDGQHLGKARTLNRAAKSVTTDVLVFLDNDLTLSPRPDMLKRLAEDMELYDLLELPKQAVASNWLSDLVAFEFLDNAITAWLFKHLAGHCPGMNGAAFAVRRDLFLRLGGFRRVIDEDSDFAARAFHEWARFGFDLELQVQTEVPLTLTDWFHQRQRWALNNLFWVKENLPGVTRRALQSPRLFLTFLIFILPFFLIPFCYLMMHSSHVAFLLPSLFMLIQQEHALAGVFLTATHVNLFLEGGFVPVTLAFAFSLSFHVYCILFYLCSTLDCNQSGILARAGGAAGPPESGLENLTGTSPRCWHIAGFG